LFLAATLDALTRRCAGWCARDNMEAQLVKDAALMAFGTGTGTGIGTGTGRVHHSDRGSQYASESFRVLLQNEDIGQSMSRKGNCYDNALGESFWARVKTECFDNFRSGIPETRAEALGSLFHYFVSLHRAVLQSRTIAFRSRLQITRPV